MKSFAISVLVFIIYRLLRWTWKVEFHEPEALKTALKNRDPVIFCHWHGDELALLQLFAIYPIGTIVSTSKDGALMDRVVRWHGGRTARGSSTRGGVGALKGLVRIVRDGWNCSFAVDGPKGPLHKVKPGVFEISKMLKLPLYWAGVSCDRAWVFPKTWNQTYLPRPFAHVHIHWFGPMPAVSSEQDPRDQKLAETLEQSLHAAKQQALASIAEPRSRC